MDAVDVALGKIAEPPCEWMDVAAVEDRVKFPVFVELVEELVKRFLFQSDCSLAGVLTSSLLKSCESTLVLNLDVDAVSGTSLL